MARRPSKHLRPVRPLSTGLSRAVERHRDTAYVVRSVSGSAATKTYRCPGCSQSILPGTPHVVAWPVEPSLLSVTGTEERRHWHTSCWRRRSGR